MTAKPQRIRDPLHDLIAFSKDEFEQGLWRLVNTREFQRLRRIKQLGFSELTFPGATHSRFAHSLGVFHTARQLIEVVRRETGEVNEERERIALAAALVHDIGHGPFSHAFEEAIENLKMGASHHEVWTVETVTRSPEISDALSKAGGEDFCEEVVKVIRDETPEDIYAAIVSSQFDADRLDYIRRDRLMTGVRHGGFDYSWIYANLKVGAVPAAVDAGRLKEIQTLVLGSKAFEAAEDYVLGLFHMYFTVYFHKTTCAAEAMFSALIQQLGRLVGNGCVDKTGLDKRDPIVSFLKTPSTEMYLQLDDCVIWVGLAQMRDAKDKGISELAARILDRKLYKAIDIMAHYGGDEMKAERFRIRLDEAQESSRFKPNDILTKESQRESYRSHQYGSSEAPKNIYIFDRDEKTPYDLSTRSKIVKALEQKSLFRVYVRDNQVKDEVMTLLED